MPNEQEGCHNEVGRLTQAIEEALESERPSHLSGSEIARRLGRFLLRSRLNRTGIAGSDS